MTDPTIAPGTTSLVWSTLASCVGSVIGTTEAPR